MALHAAHRAALSEAGAQPSMSRSGNSYDNAAMESFLATYKWECVALAEEQGGYPTRAEAQVDAFAYFETYDNTTRLHRALDYLSPVDFEKKIN
jgi:putative transposase